MTQIVVNGNAYSDDGSAARDMRQGGHRDWLLLMLGDTMEDIKGATGAVQAANAKASADSAATSASRAEEAVAGVTTGSTENLVYPALVKNLATGADVVDVFVYDTRKDSDGGAWTERLSRTSWWNEALNTAIRGAKRAFPKVAIIVARQTTLTIYDALDLDPATGTPRMWMAFNGSDIRMLPIFGSSTPITSIFALNGQVYVASASRGYTRIDFNADLAAKSRNPAIRYGIAERDVSNAALWLSNSLVPTISSDANHVHARVLPGAPLDPVSGLPIPTVAVATAAGVSVIHPNGRVCNITGSAYAKAFFASDNRLVVVAATGAGVAESHPVPYAATVANTASRTASYSGSGVRDLYLIAGTLVSAAEQALGSQTGLNFLAENNAQPSQGMVSYAAINYATGWLPGDIRLAALCDGEVGAIAGSGELITNGDFASGISGWDAVFSTLSHESGAIRVTILAGGNVARARQAIPTVVGQDYVVTFSVISSGGGQPRLFVGASDSLASAVFQSDILTTGSYQFQFTATTTTSYINLRNNNTTEGNYADYDNISIKAGTRDRSYGARGLAIVGALTRAAVNTGNDLAAWSGWSASNYLEQPYNSNLDFGTGDFFFSTFINMADANGVIAERAAYSGGYSGIKIVLQHEVGVPVIRIRDGDTVVAQLFGTSAINDGIWHQLVALRRSGVVEIWVDGVRQNAGANTTNTNNSAAALRIGLAFDSGLALSPASLALFRIGAYAPTPAQIAKLYADERPLFDAGAKAFLGGTSNSVSGLSYSEASRQLAVATNDGVSVFSGLRRVEYLDAANTSPAIASDTMRAVSMEAGIVAFGTSANAGVRRDAITGLDRMPAAPVRLNTLRRMRATGVTTDATPLSLAPRINIGERETVMVEAAIIGRVYGAADSERLSYVRKATYYRDAGGNVTLQGSVQTLGTDTETTSGADATLAIDTTAQTVTPQVTGVAATRIVWSAEIRVRRVSEGVQYEEVA